MYWFYMFSFYNFIFQRLIWKEISVSFLWFDYWILKEWKTAKGQNHSIPFTQIIGPLFDMFTGAMFTFSSAKFLNMCKPRTGWPTLLDIKWKWASKLIELARDCECRLARFPSMRNFLANKNRQTFSLGNPLHIISSLFRHFCLFQNAILHKMLKLGFWNFKLFFLRM